MPVVDTAMAHVASAFGSEGGTSPLSPISPTAAPHVVSKNSDLFMSEPLLSSASLLEPIERLQALTCGHLDQPWLFLGDNTDAKQERRGTQCRRSVLAAVCALLVLVNCNDTVLKAYSQQRGQALGQQYMPSSVMLVSNMISVVIGIVCALLFPEEDPKKCMAFRRYLQGRQLLRMSLPAVLFTISGTLKFVALGLVPPDVVSTLEQGAVLLCALLGWLCLRKSYTAAQWAALLAVSGGLLWHQNTEHRAAAGEMDTDWHAVTPMAAQRLWRGLLLMGFSVLAVTAGGLSCEVMLKGARLPFYVQKAQMELAMAGAGLFYALVLQPLLQGSCPLQERGLFHGWDGLTVLVLLLHTAKSWLATTTVLLLDNLTYTLAGNVAMLFVYVERLLLLSEDPWESFDAEALAALSATALGVACFAGATARQGRRKMELQKQQQRTEKLDKRARRMARRPSKELPDGALQPQQLAERLSRRPSRDADDLLQPLLERRPSGQTPKGMPSTDWGELQKAYLLPIERRHGAKAV